MFSCGCFPLPHFGHDFDGQINWAIELKSVSDHGTIRRPSSIAMINDKIRSQEACEEAWRAGDVGEHGLRGDHIREIERHVCGFPDLSLPARSKVVQGLSAGPFPGFCGWNKRRLV